MGGVEVFYGQELLAEVFAIPDAREYVLDQVLEERNVGLHLAQMLAWPGQQAVGPLVCSVVMAEGFAWTEGPG